MVVICGIWAESIVLFWYKSNNNVELSMTYKIVDVVITWVMNFLGASFYSLVDGG